ncbi:MAG TPA: cytochrome c-type biogenesis protein, partial [Candidatus Binatia bacterium]
MLLRSIFVLIVLSVLSSDILHAATTPDLEDRTREIAAELRCVVCQNLSVADSPSEMAQQMRAIVREQLEAGKSPEEIKEFFVSKYGEWVLLKPKTTGFSALLWILPYTVLVLGVIAGLWFIRRWVAKTKTSAAKPLQPTATASVNSALLNQAFQRPDLKDTSPRAELLREQGRLKDELRELVFDFQSGKLSDSDYAEIK